MLTEQEAQTLMVKLVDLRNKFKECEEPNRKSLLAELQQHEQICMDKFRYLVTMKTGRYKSFGNYEDLNQDGFEALLKAMSNYKPEKGSFFWWAHRYIDTRISRSANLHTTIRYPLKVAKKSPPHKEALMPLLIENRHCPDKELEKSQIVNTIQSTLSVLTDNQREIISLAYGFDGDKPMSINKICNKFNISRQICLKTINIALAALREAIKI